MTAPSSPAPEPLLDLERLVAGIRRRRRSWLGLAALGLICGALFTLLAPPPPTALVRLMIVHEDEGAGSEGTLMETDVALLETTQTAAGALRRLDGDVTPEALLKSYEAEGLTNNVLELTVRGPNDTKAIARAEALAEAFIADHLLRVQGTVDAQIRQVRERRAEVEAELARATDDAYRGELATRLNELGKQVEEIAMAVPRVEAGTATVDGPRAITESLLMIAARNLMVALALGAGAGLALAAVAAVVQDRPVLRREIAANLGASVIAQLPSSPDRKLLRWGTGRATTERERLAATLARLVGPQRGAVSVLELGCATTAATLALDLAGRLTADSPVVVVDNLPGRDLGSRTPDPPIEIRDGAELLYRTDSRNMSHHIGVGSVEPGTAWTDLPLLGAESLLVVRAGHADTAWLHTVARQLADNRITVLGVVVVRPDPRDRSDGTLWDSLHTALRGRTSQEAEHRANSHPTEYLPAVGSAARTNVEVP